MASRETAGREFEARAGSRRARVKPRNFAEFYDEHIWRVYGFIGYRVNSREEAEDLTQLTFERALRSWSRFDPGRSSPLTWLLAIARNLLIDHYRSAAATSHRTLEEFQHPSEDPIAELSLGLSPELDRALGALSDRDRELVALRYGADLRGPEIAELTGLSLANVHQILSRSVRRLREQLARGADAPQPDPESGAIDSALSRRTK